MLKSRSNNNLRFGVMLNTTTIELWQKQCISFLIEDGAKPELVILNKTPDEKPSFLRRLKNYPWSRILFRLYFRFVFNPASKKAVDCKDLIGGAGVLSCVTEKRGISNWFTEEDVGRIRSLNLDLILRFGFGIVKGDILEVARYGIWSFHHGDEQKYRGTPPGFWEIFENNEVTGMVLQQLTDKLDSGIILKKGYLKTLRHSWKGHVDQLYFSGARWPVQVCRDIINDNFSPVESKSDAKIYKTPTNGRMLIFLARIFKNRFMFHFHETFHAEHWNVGIINKPVTEIMETGTIASDDISWFPLKSKSIYYADVFPVTIDQKQYLLYEHYSYKTKKGVIDARPLSDFTITGEQNSVIDVPWHLSYPFVFEHEGDLFCVPESFNSNDVRLYRWDLSVAKFEFVRTLIDDAAIVDPTLLYHNNRWWLFCTKAEKPSTELYIYHTADLAQPFKEHENNPVKIDIRSSRPAGKIIEHNGMLLRPAQNCALHYGTHIEIFRIKELTDKIYIEEPYKIIYPDKRSKYGKGLHTLNSLDNMTFIDGKRFVFNFPNFRNRISEKTKKLFNKN